MNASKYSGFCVRVFGKVLPKQNEEELEEKNLYLEQANISMDYLEYIALVLMNTLLGVLGAFIAAFVIFILVPSVFTTLLLFLLPTVVALGLAGSYLYLPKYYIKQRARNIDLFLPYAINFISSMAVAGISPAEIFSTLATIEVYGEVQNEAKKITKDIEIIGLDNISALKHALDISPSRKFKVFLQGIIGVLQSGSDLHLYLCNIVEKYMEEDFVARKSDLDLLAVIAEVFVISVIAFPIFLVIILTTMGFFGGSMDTSLAILLLFSYLVLPVIYLGFYFLIRSTSIEEITEMRSKERSTAAQYYKRNRVPLLILVFSACIVVFFYTVLNVLSYYGYLVLNVYTLLDFVFLAILFFLAPIGTYQYMETKKKKDIQDRLPEFLVEVGDSLNTGMTIFDAIKVAEKGHYGRLSPEIKKMKAQLSWNISMKEVFNEFAERMKTAIVQRLVITINRGLMMGGNTPRIFKAAAKEVDQVNRLEYQRKTNMSIYTLTILMCFFVFLAIIVILDKTIFTSFLDLQGKQAQEAISALTLSSVDPMYLRYSLYSFVFVQSIGAGVLAGFMADGNLSSGIRYSVALGLISFFVFKFLF